MLRRQASLELEKMGMRLAWDRDYGEYCVFFVGERGTSAYYTPDLDDALGTGRAMASERAAWKARPCAVCGRTAPVRDGACCREAGQ